MPSAFGGLGIGYGDGTDLEMTSNSTGR
jgi:hypothetical protein